MSDDLLNFLDQTAALRHSPRWAGVRQLLAERGCDPGQTLLFLCDHAGGPDMAINFATPDGEIVECIMREDEATRQYTAIVEWDVVPLDGDKEWQAAYSIVTTPSLAAAFSELVSAFHVLGVRLETTAPNFPAIDVRPAGPV